MACEPEEGEGGGASIQGQVVKRIAYSSPILGIEDSIIDEYPAIDERVYIVYGDDQIYSDDFKTDYDGWYKFEYLKKGDYTLYVYEECDTCPEKVRPVFLTIELEKNNDFIEAEPIYIYEEE